MKEEEADKINGGALDDDVIAESPPPDDDDDDGGSTAVAKKSRDLMPVDLLESCRSLEAASNNNNNDAVVTAPALTVDALRKAGVVDSAAEIRLIDDDVIDDFVERVKECAGGGQPPPPLKSALKKSGCRSGKGLKVSFHDAHVIFIDTESEVSSEQPQLLTVRTFDLAPLSDIRVFTPTFDFVPSLPPGRHYTYEDAIVSFDDCDDILVCRNVNVAPPSSSGACKTLEDDIIAPPESNVDSASNECPLLTALQQEAIAEVSPELTTSDVIGSLTEANLKQHDEILMATGDSETADDAPQQQSERALSPPLKELSVDVTATGSGSAGDDWHVELSPLNSIPESEESGESSASSQDTIIMMTSEESRRNEAHIRKSTEIYNRKCKYSDVEGGDDDRASSPGSDDTLKEEEATPSTTAVCANGDAQRQRTCDEIRQIFERNAERRRRNAVTSSKDARRTTPIDRQRQWRSHESLLDTIKKLTLEECVGDVSNGGSDSPAEISTELKELIAFPPRTTANPKVPSDVRQWKIRSNQWASVDNVNGGGDVDELLLFVSRDSERIERLRKRYSYTDGDDYDSGSFARRPSVRGIKPRFGSTTEILKQLQSQLQPPPLLTTSGPSQGHVTWPYPRGGIGGGGSRQPLSSVDEEEGIYGKRPLVSYGTGQDYQPVYRTRMSGSVQSAGPPPYQPPPIPYRGTGRLKDERGVPEGASSSPKVLCDSVYRHQASAAQVPSTGTSGCVYYVMQI